MLNDKKIIKAWTFYDWANSSYNLIINSAIFPGYFTAIVPATVLINGTSFKNDTLASFAIALAYLIIASISPLLSAIADTRGNKKFFMKIFCTIGALSCTALFFFKKDGVTHEPNLWYGLFFSILACIGYCGSIVFYNAYLPQIASVDKQDAVSARGFSMGYVGSVLLLLVSLFFILKFEGSSLPARLSFVGVGLWWLGWAQIPFAVLPNIKPETLSNKKVSLMEGYKKLLDVWQQLKKVPALATYLMSFFFITMGVQTIMFMATYFAATEIHLQTPQLIITILLIQIVAIGGAYFFSKVSKHYGNKISIIIMLCIWILICLAAAFYVYTPNQFYALAAIVGSVMGGIQSTTRSTYSKLLPATNDTTSFFSFYDVVEKIGIVLGMLTYGIISNEIGARYSAAALGIYFLIGLLIISKVKLAEGKKASF
jgi:MFS transporter, UMF1 family